MTNNQAPVRHWAMDQLPLSPVVHSVFQSPYGSPIQSVTLHFVCNNIMGDYVKALAEIKVNDIYCSPLHRNNHLTTEGNQVVRAQSTLANSVLALPNYFPAALLSSQRNFYTYLKCFFLLNTPTCSTLSFLLFFYKVTDVQHAISFCLKISWKQCLSELFMVFHE